MSRASLMGSWARIAGLPQEVPAQSVRLHHGRSPRLLTGRAFLPTVSQRSAPLRIRAVWGGTWTNGATGERAERWLLVGADVLPSQHAFPRAGFSLWPTLPSRSRLRDQGWMT